MRIVCWQTILMIYHTLFYSKIRKDVAKSVVCCSRDWRFKSLLSTLADNKFIPSSFISKVVHMNHPVSGWNKLETVELPFIYKIPAELSLICIPLKTMILLLLKQSEVMICFVIIPHVNSPYKTSIDEGLIFYHITRCYSEGEYCHSFAIAAGDIVKYQSFV